MLCVLLSPSHPLVVERCGAHGADHHWCGAAATASRGYATSSIVQPPIPIKCGICRGCLHGSTCHDASSPSWAPHSTQKLCETHGPDHRWCGPITDECGACARLPPRHFDGGGLSRRRLLASEAKLAAARDLAAAKVDAARAARALALAADARLGGDVM